MQPMKLESIEALHTLLFEVMSDGVLIVDRTGHIRDCNPIFHQRLGYAKVELIGKSVADLDPPEFRARVPERLAALLRDGEGVFETAHYRRDGSIMPVELNARFVEIDGEVLIFSIVRDISERKRSEAALDEKQRMYTALVEASVDGFFAADIKGRIIEVNEAYVRRSGYSREELLGMRISDIEASESSDETRTHIEQIIREGHDRFESWHHTRSGERYPVEINATYWPLNGGIFLVFAVDISERIAAQQEIAAKQQELIKLSQALAQAGEGVVITNPDAVIEYVNKAFSTITGYACEEAVGQRISILKSDAQNPDIYRDLWHTITHGRRWEGTLIDRRKNGSFFPAQITITPIFNDDGDIIHYVSIQKDVTEQKQLEHQLLQAQKMESMGTLVGGIAHDFNNMLAAVRGNAYLASRKLDDRAETESHLAAIKTLTERAAAIVRQLLTFAKKDIVEFEVVDLNRLIREGFSLASSTIPDNVGHHLSVCDERLLTMADITQLQQVMINLTNNARDALEGAPSPRIDWSLEHFINDHSRSQLTEAAYARITVRDNGQGIDPKHLNAIFDPFFTTKAVDKGTGLGLAMVIGSIERHGGLVEVESTLGSGTAFYLYLPLTELPVTAKAEAVLDSESGNQETILLVDDNQELRSTTAEVLQDLGYRVIEASDGQEALALFNARMDEVDLILSDIVMPGISGVELIREARKQRPGLPALLVTGYDRDQIPDATALQECVLLSKPYSFATLSRVVHQLLLRQ